MATGTKTRRTKGSSAAALKAELDRLRAENENLRNARQGGLAMYNEESRDGKRMLLCITNGGRATRFGVKKAQFILDNIEEFAGLVAKLDKDAAKRAKSKSDDES